MKTRVLFLTTFLLLAVAPALCGLEEMGGAIAGTPNFVLDVSTSDTGFSAATDYYSVSVDSKKGLLNARRADGSPLLKNAFALWKLRSGDEPLTVPTAGSFDRTHDTEDISDSIGKGTLVRTSFPYQKKDVSLNVVTEYKFYEDEPFFVIVQRLENTGDKEYRITKSNPLVTESDRRGGFFPGEKVEDVWVLENGHKRFFDFFVRLVNATAPVDSNWNAGYFDRGTGKTTVVGFITAERGFVSVRSIFNEEKTLKESGLQSLTTLKAEVAYEPSSVIRPGETFEAEKFYIGISDGPLPHPALEKFADTAGKYYNLKPWAKDIPTGWNAWATKYHHDLTHENMLENAQRAAEDFLPFGMTTFQIDDGYQQVHGDWFANPERFPEGMGGIAKDIANLGFRPGIWSQPFCVSTESKLAKEHPDWIAPKNKMGEMMMPKDWLILDPTHPEVQDWLRETYTRYTSEWGYKVLKLDFIYFVQLSDKYHDPDATAVEAYRMGMQTIRNAMGPDNFMIAVGVPVGNSLGFADSLRFGLDITPDWQDDEGYAAQGVKPMVRNVARRYYLNGRVWINHPDMFYLGSEEEKKRWGGSMLTLEESRTYATLASIEGSIVKIGDSFVGLDDTQIDLLRRLLPVYHGTARPIDLFECLYPEIWHLPVEIGGEQYHIITLFNWGRNRRWGKIEEEREKEIVVDLAGLGLDPEIYLTTESWSGDYIGEVKDELRVDMVPRTVKVFALRARENHRPQLIYSNRHITQGATDIESLTWDPEAKKLTGVQQSVAGYEYRLMFRCPEGYVPEKAVYAGGEIGVSWKAPVAAIEFTPAAGGKTEWEIYFNKK
ncbi:glycoside hydrolase family 36 protein [bacterium]